MANDYKKTKKVNKKEAKRNMTRKQIKKCHAIIHTAAAACAAAGAIPIPIADAIPISAAQITMVLSLGAVFDLEVSESTAKGLLSAAASTFVGRNLVKLIPGIGWVISATVAAGVTEAIGWGIAVDFAKSDYSNGYQDGCADTSATYEAKLVKQAKEFAEKMQEFAKEREHWEKNQQEQAYSDKEIQKFLEDCLKYIADLEKERDALFSDNLVLSVEKQELLEKLYKIRTKLST